MIVIFVPKGSRCICGAVTLGPLRIRSDVAATDQLAREGDGAGGGVILGVDRCVATSVANCAKRRLRRSAIRSDMEFAAKEILPVPGAAVTGAGATGGLTKRGGGGTKFVTRLPRRRWAREPRACSVGRARHRAGSAN